MLNDKKKSESKKEPTKNLHNSHHKKFESPTFQKSKGIKNVFSTSKIKKIDSKKLESDLVSFVSLEHKFNKSKIDFAFKKLRTVTNNHFYLELWKLKCNMKTFFNSFPEYPIDNILHYITYLNINTPSSNEIHKDVKYSINNTQTTTIPFSSTRNNDYFSDIENYKLENTIMSDDSCMYDYLYKKKSNSVFFEISFKERAMSESKMIPERLLRTNNISIEDLQSKIIIKQKNIEGNKNQIQKNSREQMKRIRTKIKDIKIKKKEEQNERRQRMQEKLEKIQIRHDLYLEERTKRAKSEQVKLDEINFIRKLERKNKESSLNKKLEKSSNRRQKLLNERVSKCSVRNKNNHSLLKNNKDYNNIEQVFRDDFIWKLLETDYLDINDAIELSNMTKFEIMKRKIIKQSKIIEDLLQRNKNKNTYIDHSKIYYNDITKVKRSKSFTNFSEEDFFEINHLFPVNLKTQKKKKKEKLKYSLLKSINSMSAGALSSAFSNLKSDKKTRRYVNIDRSINQNLSSQVTIKIQDDEASFMSINSKEKNDCNNNKSSQEGSGEKEELKESKFSLDTLIFSNDNNYELTGLLDKLDKSSSKVKFCKLCNTILQNEFEANNHILSKDHKKIKIEYNLADKDDTEFIIVFISEVSEELKTQRINSIKLKFKKIKQKIALKSLKHDNWTSLKTDTMQSTNKQRILKVCFDIEKLINQNSREFEVIELNLKELLKILEQKKQSDLHLIRSQKIILHIFDLMKKPPFSHKSEIKAIGKVLEIGIKILMIFMSLRENKNYLIMTNRICICVDLLLWILNYPSKIPLGIGFLPDLVYLIIVSLRHKIPYEYQSIKDDLIDYILYSGLLFKLKLKYASIQGPIDLTTNLGSLPLFIQRSLQMIESLIIQLYFNNHTKPVYVSLGNLSDNIIYILESSELLGQVQLLYTLLLSDGPYKPKFEKEGLLSNLPQTVITASISSIKILNSIARVSLITFQKIFSSNSYLQDIICPIFHYILSYSLDHLENSDDAKELLHETILLIGYFTLLDNKLQTIMVQGELTLTQKLFSLPFNYFFDSKLKEIFMPTAICLSFENERVMEILNKEINLNIFVKYLKDKINLEPIVEEELDESLEEKGGYYNCKNEILSNISSTKSLHNMIIGVSDFIPLILRFPRKQWEKALEFYNNYNI